MEDHDLTFSDFLQQSDKWISFLNEVLEKGEENCRLNTAKHATATIAVRVIRDDICIHVKVSQKNSPSNFTDFIDLPAEESDEMLQEEDASDEKYKNYVEKCHQNYLEWLKNKADDECIVSEEPIIRGFWFKSLDHIIAAADRFKTYDSYFSKTMLYKSETSAEYFLWIKVDVRNLIYLSEFSRMIEEYGYVETRPDVIKGHLTEFGKLLVKEYVLEKLGNLK